MVVATGQGLGFPAGIRTLGGLSGLLWGAGGEVGHGKGCRAAGDLDDLGPHYRSGVRCSRS